MSAPYFPGLLDQQPPAPSMMQMAPPIARGPSAAPITQRMRPYRGSLFDRFKQALMPTPAGMEGMLNPEQESAGRSQGLLDMGLSLLDSGGPVVGAPALSMGQALARGIHAGREGFAQHAQNDVAGGLLQDEQARKQQMLSQRQMIQQKYQLPPNATADQTEAALKGMFAEFVRNGDTEMVGKLAQVIPSLQRSGKTTDTTEWQNFGGYSALLDKATGAEIRRVERTPSPKDPNAPDHAAELSDQRMFQREQQLADDFNKDTKDSREMAQKVAGAISEAPAAKAGDGVAQVNLLYAFVSSMDPGSAVREGEIGLVRSAGSLVQQAQGLLAKYAQGQAVTVPPAMVDQLAGLMKRRLDGSRRYVSSRSKYYEGRAKNAKLKNWEMLFPGLDEDQAPVGATAAAKPSAGIVNRHGAPPGR